MTEGIIQYVEIPNNSQLYVDEFKRIQDEVMSAMGIPVELLRKEEKK